MGMCKKLGKVPGQMYTLNTHYLRFEHRTACADALHNPCCLELHLPIEIYRRLYTAAMGSRKAFMQTLDSVLLLLWLLAFSLWLMSHEHI